MLKVITRNGGDPLVAYEARLPLHGSTERHREALEALLRGDEVQATDSEISYKPASGKFPITIIVRFPGDQYRTRLVLTQMTEAEHVTHCPDEKPFPPTVQNWCNSDTSGVRWQLHAGVVRGLFSDRD